MENGKWQIGTGNKQTHCALSPSSRSHLPFHICHLPFEIVFGELQFPLFNHPIARSLNHSMVFITQCSVSSLVSMVRMTDTMLTMSAPNTAGQNPST